MCGWPANNHHGVPRSSCSPWCVVGGPFRGCAAPRSLGRVLFWLFSVMCVWCVCVWQPGLSGHFSFSSISLIANRLLNQTKTRVTQAIPVGALLILTLILATGCMRGDGRTEQAVADVDGKVQVFGGDRIPLLRLRCCYQRPGPFFCCALKLRLCSRDDSPWLYFRSVLH